LAAGKRAVKDPQVYVQPSARTATKWTPGLIRWAELSADGGSLRAAADCFDWILTDERCRGVFETRVGSLLGAALEFEDGAKRARVAQRVLRALEVQEDWWAMLPEASLMKVMVWGLGLGLGLGELFPWEDKHGRLVPSLRWWNPRWLRYDFMTGTWMLTVSRGPGLGATEEIEIHPGDRRWLLFCPFGNETPWVFGLWRGVSRFRLLKSLAVDDWGRHSENAARLVVEGQSPEVEISLQVRKELARDIKNAGAGQVIALPGGVTAKLIELTANTRDIYQAQVDCANLAYAVGVLGQNMTTEIRGGSFAASQTSSEVEARRIRYDAEVGATIIHDQVLVPWAEVNFGSADVAPWPKWMVEPPKDTVKWASTLAQAVPPLLELEKRFTNAGLESPVDWEEVFKELGVPAVEGYDFLAKLKAPTPPPLPPPQTIGGEEEEENASEAGQASGENAPTKTFAARFSEWLHHGGSKEELDDLLAQYRQAIEKAVRDGAHAWANAVSSQKVPPHPKVQSESSGPVELTGIAGVELAGIGISELRAEKADPDRHGESVQDWTDDINREAAHEATESLRPEVEQLIDELRKAGTWTLARETLVRRLGNMGAEELANTLHEPLTLLQLAGTASELESLEKAANWPKLGKEAGRWQEAIDLLRKKTNVSRADFDLLDAAARTRAFTVAHVTHLDLIAEIHDSLVKAERAQQRFEDWRDEQWDKLAKEWELHGGPRTPAHIAWRLETIWRTNTQAALNAGRYAQQVDPDILALRPYWYLVVVDDGRTSDICRELISPKVILPASDPVWSRLYPPLHHCCRDRVTTLDAEQARAKGILKAAPTTKAADGFGAAPGKTLPEWEPDLTTRPPELAEMTRRKLADVPKPPKTEPLTRKLPAKYDPDHWFWLYRERYDEEAARAMAQGRVALERGLDMPIGDAVTQVRSLADSASLWRVQSTLEELAAGHPEKTLRQLRQLQIGKDQKNTAEAAAAIVGHCSRVTKSDRLGLRVTNPKSDWPGNPALWAESTEGFFVQMVDRNLTAPTGWTAEFGWKRGEMVPLEKLVRVSPKAGVLHHELAHAFEELNPAVHHACVAFLRSRTQGEVLHALANFDPSYGDNEFTRPDKFGDPYVGKHYPDDRFTEVLSMGTQWIADGSWASFADQDRDMLLLILGCLSGRI
jgi:phage gp29-like protein